MAPRSPDRTTKGAGRPRGRRILTAIAALATVGATAAATALLFQDRDGGAVAYHGTSAPERKSPSPSPSPARTSPAGASPGPAATGTEPAPASGDTPSPTSRTPQPPAPPPPDTAAPESCPHYRMCFYTGPDFDGLVEVRPIDYAKTSHCQTTARVFRSVFNNADQNQRVWQTSGCGGNQRLVGYGTGERNVIAKSYRHT